MHRTDPGGVRGRRRQDNNPQPESLNTAVSLSMRPVDPGNKQHEHLNCGKQTLLLDLHVPESREVLNALIDAADVVMQNFAQGVAERYGLGYEQVRARKPDVIYFSLSAYDYNGPMGGFRGFEGNARAATGLMHRFGGDGPPLGQPYLLDDYGTGIRGNAGGSMHPSGSCLNWPELESLPDT